MQKITVLGSTGSIGANTLDILKKYPEYFQAYALTGYRNVRKMHAQCILFQPCYVAMVDETAALMLRQSLKDANISTEVLSGAKAVCELAALPEVDQVMAAIVGSAGVLPTLAALQQGKRVLLANKESLVTCGQFFMEAVKTYSATLLPVDSEHNAIFQSMPEHMQRHLGQLPLSSAGITNIILTGSGGPFRDLPATDLAAVSIAEAVAHPNWSMGRKISVDSATMMNKGLEYIEARWLFNASADEIDILIHPQSVIHSMVRYQDGSVIAQLGNPDMRVPIAYALGYPYRMPSGVAPLDFTSLSGLTFTKPDMDRYPCLKLAISAFACGQATTTILNAANEVAVDAFLTSRIGFIDIPDCVERTLAAYSPSEPISVHDVLAIDCEARRITADALPKVSTSAEKH